MHLTNWLYRINGLGMKGIGLKVQYALLSVTHWKMCKFVFTITHTHITGPMSMSMQPNNEWRLTQRVHFYLGNSEAKFSRPHNHLHLKHVTSRRAGLDQLLKYVLAIKSTYCDEQHLTKFRYRKLLI